MYLILVVEWIISQYFYLLLEVLRAVHPVVAEETGAEADSAAQSGDHPHASPRPHALSLAVIPTISYILFLSTHRVT